MTCSYHSINSIRVFLVLKFTLPRSTPSVANHKFGARKLGVPSHVVVEIIVLTRVLKIFQAFHTEASNFFDLGQCV